MSISVDVLLHGLAGGQLGLVTRAQLLEDGVTARQVQVRRTAGLLVPVHRGVMRVAGFPVTFESEVLAACLAAEPGAFADRRTAGRLHGLRRMHAPRLELAVPAGGRTRAPKGCLLRQVGDLTDEDVVVRDDGIRVASPLATLFGLAAVVPIVALEQAIEDAQHRGLVTVDEVGAYFSARRRRGLPGSDRAGRWLAGAAPGRAPRESGLEQRLFDALAAIGMPLPVPQLPVTLLDGRVVRLDGGYPEIRLGLEIDGAWFHDGVRQAEWDAWRDGALGEVGWQVHRVKERPLLDDDRACALRIARIYAERAPLFGVPIPRFAAR